MVKMELLPLQMECTMLFQSNPYMIETIQGLESRLGRTKEDLQPILDLLVKQGIIQKMGDETSSLFRYQEPVVIEEFDITSELESI